MSGSRRDRGGAGGARGLTVRVKSARKRKPGSTRWLQRQLNDPYVAAAKREGYRSRAAFKLAEIDDRHQLLRSGMTVVDLGAAPGGWSQVAAARVQSDKGRGRVMAADINPLDPIPGVSILQADILDETAPGRLRAEMGGRLADLVLSDMAAPTTGHKQTDHLRTMALCEAAYDFASEVLAPGGAFLAKVIQGGTERELLDRLKQDFDSVKHVKPKASRAESAELYVLATGFGKAAEAS
ncbi:MAG: RlmE family RNA methyltransferase [Pseudomonadota bacterium]|nr:RlmE family RNA methyltransferase [Pseudomonadota bacterium]